MDNRQHSQNKVKASKSKIQTDLEDQHGIDSDEQRARAVFIRQDNEGSAMDNVKRFRAKFWNTTSKVCCYFRGPRRRRRRKKKKIDEITPDHDNAGLVVGTTHEADNNIGGEDEEADDDNDDDAPGRHTHQQYQLAYAPKTRHVTWRIRLASFLCCCGLLETSSIESVGMVPGTTRNVLRFLHWMFRVNIILLFFFMCFMFFSMCLLFAALIVSAGDIDPSCVRVGEATLADYPSRFFNAFFLSWTTFSTVGYGAIYPSVGNQQTNRSHCFYVSAVCSLEALLGIVYSGFCGAILFSKVLRVQHHAQVVFSDPIVIQYGSGVEAYDDPEGVKEDTNNNQHANELSLDSIVASVSKPKKEIPLPVLEFRIVNKLFAEPGGEIIDATLNVVANIDASDVDPSLRNALDPAMQLRRALAAVSTARKLQSLSRARSRQHSWAANMQASSRPRSRQHSWSNSEEQTIATSDSKSEYDDFFSTSEHPPSTPASSVDQRRRQRQRQSSWGSSSSQMSKFFDPFGSVHTSMHSSNGGQEVLEDLNEHKAVDEDPTSNLVTKRIFSKMHLEASEHPFFKRVWLARHVLDEHSPLLKPKVRRHIGRNGGFWPERLNSYEGVRESLKFNQIVVSLKGVSNISAAHVFAQKIYDHVDLSVGYRFQNLFFRNLDGHIQVDKDLINDVIEQKGGGGEPLMVDV